MRRKIINIIGENKFSSFTLLKKELKVSTGTIYHHLDTLSQLIEQKDDKKYYLTELGLHAYDSLKDNIDTIITPDFSKKEFNSPSLNEACSKSLLITLSVQKKEWLIFSGKK